MARAAATVSLSEFAAFHGYSEERIRQLCGEGMPHRMQSGNYRLVPAKASTWLRDRDRRERRDAEAPDEAKERAAKLRVERELKEVELDRLRGELMPLQVHDEAVETLVAGLAATAAGQLSRFERDIVRAATPAEARVITQQIHAALMQGAQDYASELEAEALMLEQGTAA